MKTYRKGLENLVHRLSISGSLLLLGLNLAISHKLTPKPKIAQNSSGVVFAGVLCSLLPAEGDKKCPFKNNGPCGFSWLKDLLFQFE